MSQSIPTRNFRRLLAIGLATALLAVATLLALTLTNSVGAEEYVEKKVTETVTEWTDKKPLTTLMIEGAAARSIERDGTVARFTHFSVLDESVLDAVSTGNSALVDVRTALEMGCNDDNPEQLCVKDEQLQTTSIRIHEEYDWIEGRRESTGFRYENSLFARIDGVEQAGLLIDAILDCRR